VRDLFRKDRGPSGDNGANLTGDRVWVSTSRSP
jgi:hypothetical protein